MVKFSKLLQNLNNLQLTENDIEEIFKGASAEELKQRRKEAPKIIAQEWLEEFLKRKDVHKNEDGFYDVDGGVDLDSMMLEKLPLIKFNKVGRDFYCHHNKLTSLKGAPTSVGRSFSCSANNLTSLEGAPQSIGGEFSCHHNKKKFTKRDVQAVSNVKGEIYV